MQTAGSVEAIPAHVQTLANVDVIPAHVQKAASIEAIPVQVHSFEIDMGAEVQKPPSEVLPCTTSPTCSVAASADACSSSGQHLDIDTSYQKLELSPNLVRLLEQHSSSRQNFIVNLVRKVYTERERETSNVHGRKGK